MNLLENLDQICTATLPPELLAIREKWESYYGGWTDEMRKEIDNEILSKPDVKYWAWWIDGLGWEPDVPEKLDRLYDLLAKAGLLTKAEAEQKKQIKHEWSPAAQVREGKAMSAWLRDYREYKAMAKK